MCDKNGSTCRKMISYKQDIESYFYDTCQIWVLAITLDMFEIHSKCYTLNVYIHAKCYTLNV